MTLISSWLFATRACTYCTLRLRSWLRKPSCQHSHDLVPGLRPLSDLLQNRARPIESLMGMATIMRARWNWPYHKLSACDRTPTLQRKIECMDRRLPYPIGALGVCNLCEYAFEEVSFGNAVCLSVPEQTAFLLTAPGLTVAERLSSQLRKFREQMDVADLYGR